MARTIRAEIFIAGGSVDLDSIRGLRDASIAGIILGEPLLSGALDFAKALEAAA
jgi:phosphoribosylformimino-5-aminoimidazole carboxamide ribonucleotide (ProFAR) isomerase